MWGLRRIIVCETIGILVKFLPTDHGSFLTLKQKQWSLRDLSWNAVCKRSGISNPDFLLTSCRLHCSSCLAIESLLAFKSNAMKNFFSPYLGQHLHNSHFYSQRNFAPSKVLFLAIIIYSPHYLFSDWPKV